MLVCTRGRDDTAEDVTELASAWRDPSQADTGAYRRDDLVARYFNRRGGTIGTSALSAVALRFDHHLDIFAAKVLPLLTHYHLPWAQIVNPERVGRYPTDSTFTFASLQAMALANGGEVWNHGGDHGDATTHAALLEQIAGSLDTLKEEMPLLAIEGWAPPGLAPGGYMGASPFSTVQQNTRTYAGRLIVGNHAVVAGYSPPLYRPLFGGNPIGATHLTIDAQTASGVARHLDAAEARQAGIALMLHSNHLDQPGYLDTTSLGQIFADVASRRDAGTMQVLSYTGLWAADSRSDHRHDLMVANSTAALTAGTAQSVTVPTGTATAGMLGSIRELVVHLRTMTSGCVTLEVTGKPKTTHALPGPGVHVLRRPVTFGIGGGPIELSVTVSVAATDVHTHLYAL